LGVIFVVGGFGGAGLLPLIKTDRSKTKKIRRFCERVQAKGVGVHFQHAACEGGGPSGGKPIVMADDTGRGNSGREKRETLQPGQKLHIKKRRIDQEGKNKIRA